MRSLDGITKSMDTLGDNEGQGSLVCYSPCSHRVRHDLATQQQQLLVMALNHTVQSTVYSLSTKISLPFNQVKHFCLCLGFYMIWKQELEENVLTYLLHRMSFPCGSACK